MSTDIINQLFENQNNWDFEAPNNGHEKRFLKKIKAQQPKKKRNWMFPISIAASILLGFGLFYFYPSRNS
jgi:hypothetical protein